MVILSASLKGVDQNLIDSARIDGCTEWQAFWRVIVLNIRKFVSGEEA